jgi:hypothetical protein
MYVEVQENLQQRSMTYVWKNLQQRSMTYVWKRKHDVCVDMNEVKESVQ